MTRDEHLYTIAGEEGVEIAQRCSKAVRFGGTEVQPGQGMDNRQRILQEFADLVGVLELLGFDIGIPAHSALRPWIDAKKEKVEKFLAYSRECGTLEPAETRAVLPEPPDLQRCVFCGTMKHIPTGTVCARCLTAPDTDTAPSLRELWLAAHRGHSLVKHESYIECEQCGATFWSSADTAPSPEEK